MFGDIKLDNVEVKVGDQIVRIEKMGGYFLYSRGDVERIIVGDKLSILPAPARGYGVRLMMIRLEKPIAIAPGKVIKGFFDVPIEVSVKVGESEIDRFSIGREKYALYGTLESGVIVRYSRGVLKDEPVSIGNVRVVVINKGEDWGFIERIVFPMLDLMYYSQERAFYPLVRVEIEEDVNVVNTGEPPLPNLKSTGKENSVRFRMRW
ncbi:hypothetical protein PNA2_0950 [Pyrococcus sp. NA2]|uniref:DUF432 domain-containing protein n=1 Tax=Pyrococcus sp. (strain NA2) TaxID=342949 RepID=UPI000209A91D|nr:DUF432 domain-containing protein [Pyrococcus sp. NA2]AEC51866.1 hypothetical protein PNA2_0950 [Pyrococcus sp. NA2]